jgi:hypothetical protein
MTCHFKVVIRLDAHPQVRRNAKEPSQLKGHFGADAALVPDNLIDDRQTRADSVGHGERREFQRFHEILLEKVTGMDGASSLCMVFHNIYFSWVFFNWIGQGSRSLTIGTAKVVTATLQSDSRFNSGFLQVFLSQFHKFFQ